MLVDECKKIIDRLQKFETELKSQKESLDLRSTQLDEKNALFSFKEKEIKDKEESLLIRENNVISKENLYSDQDTFIKEKTEFENSKKNLIDELSAREKSIASKESDCFAMTEDITRREYQLAEKEENYKEEIKNKLFGNI